MVALNEKELLILETLVEGNAEKFGFLKSHFESLYVESRKTTGTSLTITFGYLKNFDDEEFVNALISAEPKLICPNLKNELTYCLDITNGKMDFLEVATNGNEIWDGVLDNCTLVQDKV
ncbi:hypothetical protein DHW03_04055 [Pedobacter yonginense]|uniref:Uncharacterized protein n=1 Tax=Pedobacter yonginense TaxID=651869 RepID=A0A317ERI5_9SPHI|nr:hypothetical protein [Pedobacter yonginense]PWS29015.1 hypothetical protein DHW03_04055 [Pedobacter yonginense]